MAFANIEDFPKKDIRISQLFKALSHPGRIAILRVLAKKKSCICGDLVADLPLAQSTVSQHLKVLKEVGIIKGEVDGPRSCYCLNLKVIKEFESLFLPLVGKLNNNKESEQTCN